jgi:hypothetical protein
MINFIFPHGYTEKNKKNILISSGTFPARETIYAAEYLPHALIPRQDWSLPTLKIIHSMTSRIDYPISRSLYIINIINKEIEYLITLVKSNKTNNFNVDDINEIFKSAISAYVEIDYNNKFKYLGLESTLDAAPTLTWDEDGIRTGLHIDSWYNDKIENRIYSPNRLCANLGPGDRYFMLLNIGIDAMKKILMERNLTYECIDNPTQIVIDFMHTFQKFPIVALKLRPGEAYIAPTEYVCHDGFVPSRFRNSSISIMGYIQPRIF